MKSYAFAPMGIYAQAGQMGMTMVNEPYDQLLVEETDGVLVVTLNRPERHNALSPQMYDDLLGVLEHAAQCTAIGAVILTGAGKSFCSGGDVSRMSSTSAVEPRSDNERKASLRQRTRIVELLHKMDKPTIAMMRGHAIGAGFSLALACDLRVADTSVRLMTGFVKVAISGDFGGHYFLPRLVGMAKARELYITSEPVNADEALRLGLVSSVTRPEALETHVWTLARGISNGPRFAMANIKRNLNDALSSSLAEMLDDEADRHVACVYSNEHREATAAFSEKRPPRFSNDV